MKIVVSEGCMASSVSIDGKDIDDLSTWEIQNAIVNVAVKLKREQAEELLREAAMRFGDIEGAEYCETCGNTNCDYTMDVPYVWKIELD